MTRKADSEAVVCEHCGLLVVLGTAAPQKSDELQDDLERVEEWWNRERRPYLWKDRHGDLHPPEEENVAHTLFMTLGGVLGLFAAMAGSMTESRAGSLLGFMLFFVFPLSISLPAALLHGRAERRYKEYQKLAAEYQGRRNAILDRHARRV